MPLSSSATKPISSSHELAVPDLRLPHDIGQAEVLRLLEGLATENGKIPHLAAVSATRYLKERVKVEAEKKLEDAKKRMTAELNEKLEFHHSNEAQAAADESALQAELKSATALLRKTELRLKSCKLELKDAIDRRETARTETQLEKAKHKSSLQTVEEHVVGEAKDRWSHLRRFIRDNTGDPLAVIQESEEPETVPSEPVCTRPFSVEEKRSVILPDLPIPSFIMAEEVDDWTQMICHRYICWAETKRITAVLTDPVIVNLMQSLKGRAHMGGVFAAWSRSVAGESTDWGKWRDIKVSHLGWQRICQPLVTRLPTGSTAMKESHAELQRVDKMLNKVTRRMFGVNAEPAWSQKGLLAPQWNTVEQAALHDVTLTQWDEEAIKWVKLCKFSNEEPEFSGVFDVSDIPAAEMPDTAPPGGPPPGVSSAEWSKAASEPRSSVSVTVSQPDDDDEDPIETVQEWEKREAARDRHSRNERARQSGLLRSSTPLGQRSDSRSGHRGGSSREDERRGQYSRDSSREGRGSQGGSRQGAKRGGRGDSRGSHLSRGPKGGRGGRFAGRGEYHNVPQAKHGRYR